MSYTNKINDYKNAILNIEDKKKDPIFLLKFYKTKMEIEDIIFPYIQKGDYYNSFNEYIRKTSIKKPPHDIFTDLIHKTHPKIHTSYIIILNISKKCRYTKKILSKKDIRRFNAKMREIEKWKKGFNSSE